MTRRYGYGQFVARSFAASSQSQETATVPQRIRRFFAIENPYGLYVRNQGNRPNLFHAFLYISHRDVFVARDPEHRERLPSSTPLARRMLRASNLWSTVDESHQYIPYLDR